MARYLLIYLKWTLLNIGLPAAAALTTYYFAHLHNQSKSVDYILATAFASGDNLIVSSIIFVILYFEIDAVSSNGEVRLVAELGKLVSLGLCIFFAMLFGAFKFYSFTHQPQDVFLHQAGAMLSISALFFTCVCAVLGKFVLIAADWRQISNGR